MTDNDVKQVTLTLNTAQAEQKLGAITQRLEEARQKKTQAFEQGNAKAYTLYAQETKKLEQQQQRLISRTQTVTRTLQSLDKATPRDLRTAITQINRQLNSGSIERGSKEWNTLTQAMAEAKNELAKINQEQRAAEKSVQERAGGLVTKWQSLTTVFSGIKSVLSSVTSTVMGYYEQYAQMAEHMTNVKKYTGLADEAVKSLNEDFMRMDTRTSREQLNDLAADAGRLGIQSKQQILDFVQAADQLNVALGEDLGEDGVKNIGKLAQLFGDSDRMGLKQAMLSTGSVINELAQSSSASEGYLMEFTARLAGVGKQANLTQAQVMAFGSILDQSMVGVEKGATALQNVIVALYANPTKMAAAAGLEVTKFTNLLKTDANAAILQFVQALQQTGGFDRLAPLLKEMHLSGSGVTQTLSALANNLDNLKQTQQQATQAFQQGTSVTNEFNTANNTAQARLDKARKAATDMAVTLGEQLAPVVEQALTQGTNIMRILSILPQFLTQNAGKIIAITATIAAYTIAINLAAIRTTLYAAASKAATVAVTLFNGAISIARSLGLALSIAYYTLTGNTIRLRAAQIALNRTLIANPYAAIAAAVVGIASAIYLWVTRERQLTQEQRNRQAILRDNAEIERKAQQSISGTMTKINLLTAIIHDNNRKLSDRQEAIRKLQSIVPGYTAQISQEGRVVRENTKAVKDYIQQLKKQALIEAARDRLKAIASQRLSINDKGYNNAVSIRTKRLADFEAANADFVKEWKMAEKAYNTEAGAMNMARLMMTQKGRTYNTLLEQLREAQGWQKGANAQISTLTAQEQNLQSTLRRLGASIDQIFSDTDTPTEQSGGEYTPTTHTTKDTGAEARRRKEIRIANARLDEEQRREEAQAAADYQLGNIKTYNQYQQKLIDIDNAYITRRLALYKEGDTEIQSLQKKQADNNTRDTRLLQDTSLRTIDNQTNAQINALKERYYRGELAEEDYQDQLDQIQETRLQRRLQWLRDPKNAADPAAINAAQEALEQNRDQQRLTRLERLFQKAKAFREQYAKQTLDEQERDELALLDRLAQAYKWSEEEKAKYKKQIQEKYEQKRKEQKEGKTDDTDDPREKRKIKDPLGSPSDEMSTSIINFMKLIDSLNLKIKDGQATWQDYAAVAVGAFAIVTAAASSATQLFTAQQQLEEAQVTKRYDAEIQKAGSTTKKGKKLEEQKQKELAQIKTKYNKKQMKIELAQAVATTAMNALKAYGAMADIPVVGPALGAIAAAAAIAAGAIQIASIKKQHAAEQEGYYSGGYTGGHNYHLPAGTVHQGEFVANHQAVANPAIRPVLDLIDQAQRTNRIARLTPADVSRAILAPQATAAATTATMTAATQTAAATTATAAAAPTTTQIITTTTQAQTDTLRRLADQLDQGIRATVTIDGPDGFDRQYRKYQRLNNI